jgi:hypothetical protein
VVGHLRRLPQRADAREPPADDAEVEHRDGQPGQSAERSRPALR